MSVRKGYPYTVTFAAIDADNRPTRETGVTYAASDVKLSKDGGAFASATNAPTELGATGRYKLDLTAAEMDAGWLHLMITHAGVDDVDMMIATNAAPTATVVTDGGNSATQFKTDRTEATNDFWKDCLILFTSGSLAGQVKKCATYVGATKILTVSSAFTATPGVGDRFTFVNI